MRDAPRLSAKVRRRVKEREKHRRRMPRPGPAMILESPVNKRRSLTPNSGMPSVPFAPRRSGVRRTLSDRVTFRNDAGAVREGWALNESRGGLRAILDEGGSVELGEEFVIVLGAPGADAAPADKRGRIVWLQEEPDGFVVGVEYVGGPGLSGMHAALNEAQAAPDGTGQVAAQAPTDASGISPAAAVSGPGSRPDPSSDA